MDFIFDFTRPGKKVHLGVCGSISAYRAPDILRNIRRAEMECSAALTEAATKFISPLTFKSLKASPVYTTMFDDMDAPSPFAHLEPGQNMDAMLIAPASASTIARIANGLADDLLSCQALAFDGPIIIAPAMNPKMWENAATRANISLLKKRGVHIVEPGWGHTACGEYGQGRLAELSAIHLSLLKALTSQDMQGLKVLITLGPTRENWDGLRFWSNPSSGKMGACLALEAFLRGAEVHAVCGPGCPALPYDIFRYDVNSANDMYMAAKDIWPKVNIGIFVAAVADFRPETVPDIEKNGKFKKSAAPEGFSIHFLPNPDIMAALATSSREGKKIMGFAAEDKDIEKSVREKLKSKKAHLIVGNLISDGFGTNSNTVFITDLNGREETLKNTPKTVIAKKALTWLLSL